MNCPYCSQPFEQTRGRGQPKKYCSRRCQANGSKSHERKLPRGERQCKECQCVFERGLFDKRIAFCSDACRRKNLRRRSEQVRRARMRGVACENVEALVVFARDGWHCQLCGISTPKRLHGSVNPRAPELDHIVPLSAGGEHSYRNTQCACRKCNNSKRANPRGQMRLFG